MPATTQPVVGLPAGVKTQLIWSSLRFKDFQVVFSVPGVDIKWERNSSLPPWHTFGNHFSSKPFWVVLAGVYCNFWLTSPVDMTATIS